jgi:hypothetical protein
MGSLSAAEMPDEGNSTISLRIELKKIIDLRVTKREFAES